MKQIPIARWIRSGATALVIFFCIHVSITAFSTYFMIQDPSLLTQEIPHELEYVCLSDHGIFYPCTFTDLTKTWWLLATEAWKQYLPIDIAITGVLAFLLYAIQIHHQKTHVPEQT
ncbi:hypothetical protein GF380_04400 [Candidatus Uhrbacteria bacterium]|nr:hypothetical protein [Candidatus Uhrbacteria bacterium]MBD3284301.1 hypothetical protein [Candidatus Uhrbacteria bacterium]